jgi:hypothetical protein
MRDTIDRNNKNIGQMSAQKREDTKRSVNDLQNFHTQERQIKQNAKVMQQEYRGILENQMKIKNSSNRFGQSPLEVETQGDGNMYMVPGINSVSPYTKHNNKGQVALGEHYLKMKSYIDKDKVCFSV